MVVAIGIDADVSWQWWKQLLTLLMEVWTQWARGAQLPQCWCQPAVLTSGWGAQFPGLGGHLVIRRTARGALLAAVDGPGDDDFRWCVQQMSLTPLWLEVVRDTGGLDVDGGCCLSSLVSGVG